MAEGDSPTVARRRVRLAIREAREANNLTQLQVAEQMEWSLSKVIRIESGEVSISVNDLRPLLAFVGIRDKAEVNSLLADARIARTRQRQAWYQKPEFREYMSDALRRLIEYEAEATAMRSYSVYYPPGPLQIPDYAAALTGGWNHEIPPESLAKKVEARRLRRTMIRERLGTLKIYLVLDQSVFERSIGGPRVLVEQLKDLHDLAERDLIRIRMLPFDLDSPIANNASFDLISIGGETGGEVMYRENGLSDEIVEDAGSTARHRERFEQLWHVADAEVDTNDFIKGRIEYLETKITERRSQM
uniref:Antitoxin component n=1 Tax=uncultured bacterium BAC AB649/1850 TaxID=1037453 RepID=F6K0Z6_9BACT|nr:antitoxin component [uncultured bacterium BAC AB649/1850]